MSLAADLPASLWRRTTEPISDDPFTDRAEIVVVGGGITGLATALMLARQGRGVLVLEARSIGAGTTGGTTGKVSLLQGSVVQGIRTHAGDDVVRAYLEANRAAQEWLRVEANGDDSVLQHRTAYTYATTPEGDDVLRSEAEAMDVGGVGVERVGAGSDLGLPFAVTSALALPDQYQVHSMRLLARLASHVRRLGGRIVQHARVMGVDLAPDGVHVRTSRGEIDAHIAVLATGTPILDRGLFFAKLVPSRSLVGAYRLTDGQDVPRDMYLSVDPESRTIRGATDAGGRRLLVAGGAGFTPGREESVLALRERLDAWVAENFPGAVRATWWAAQDYRMVTHVPFAGMLPRGGGRIYAATGFNKWGLTNGVAGALTIAGAVAGERPPWAERLAAHHATLGDAREATEANLQVAGHLVGGWTRAELSAAPAEPPAEGAGRVIRSGLTPVAESTVDGVTCRLSAVCTHLGGIVSWNDAERTWDCPLHGSRFDSDGRLLEGPAVADLGVVS